MIERSTLRSISKLSVVVRITSFASRHDAIAYHNIWADFWRYNIGVNVIPADTKNKKPVVPWFGWQSKAIPESLHRQWKTEGLFSNGIAVILGKVWHRQDLTNYYLVGADADSKKAIDEICTYNGKSTILEEFAAKTLVEQHRDNPNKAHFYFYATRPIKGKSSDNALLAHRLSANEIPAIEIKSLGSHGILYCSGSFHKDGYNYEIIGSRKPAILNELQTAELENHFNNIFNKYMISYLSIGSADNSASAKTKLPIEKLFKPDYKVLEGHNRHEALLRVMESLILRNHNISKNWNNTHCMPPLDDREFEGQWECALEFVASKQRQLSWQNDIGSQDHNQSITAEERQQEQNSHSVSELAEEILSKYEFKTLADTEETLYYRDGIYHSGGEQIIKTELEKIAGYSIKINQRNEIIAHIKYRTIVNREEFDRNESVINVKNGLLDITTGEIRPHKHDYLSIIQSPVTYDPRATCPRVIKFLTGVQTRDGISTLVRLFGYCLYRSPRYEKAIMLVGPGRNGKSVLIKLIEALVGVVLAQIGYNINYLHGLHFTA